MLWHCWLDRRKGIWPLKNGGWWRWALVSPDGVAPSRIVSVSASVILPLHHKVQKFSSGTGSPRWSRKKGHETVVVAFYYKHTKHVLKNITWSQLNHPTLTKRSTVCTRQELGREHSILQYVTITHDVYQVCHSVGHGVVLMKHRSESHWTVLLGYLTISTHLNVIIMSFITILYFSKTVHRCILHSTQSNCCSAKLSTSFLLS